MTTQLDEVQIKGITGKLLRGLVVQTAVVVTTVCTVYFTIKGDVAKLYTLREENERIWSLKFDQLANQNRLLQTQLDGVQQANQALQHQLDIINIQLDAIRPVKK